MNVHTWENRSLLQQARCQHLHPPDTRKVHTTACHRSFAHALDQAPPWVIAAGSEIELCTSSMAGAENGRGHSDEGGQLIHSPGLTLVRW